ncbi:MAG: glycosyltransferase [Kiritimatiellia bacterium]
MKKQACFKVGLQCIRVWRDSLSRRIRPDGQGCPSLPVTQKALVLNHAEKQESINAEAKLAPDERPRVSVIVVTKCNHAEAEAAVASIIASDYPPDRREIVVIEETDKPQPFSGPGVRYFAIARLNRGVGAARNEGLLHASGEIIAFTDDDCLVDRNWLKELVWPLLANPEAGATAGAVLVPDCGPIGQCESILGFPGGGVRYAHASRGSLMPLPTFSTCNCAIRRSTLKDGLRFNEGFNFAGEDQMLSRAISAKHPILYNPDARVRHKPRDSFAGVFKWLVRRGQAQVETVRHSKSKAEHIAYMIYTSLPLRLLAAAALFAALSLPVVPALGILFLFYYACMIWRFRWARAYYPPLRTMALLPIVKLVMDAGMSAGVLKALFAKKRVQP